MDLFRMRCFVSVATHLNLTRAAGECGITQPAMSVQMREIERECGVQLLTREHGRIGLTDAGAMMRDCFASMLDLYESSLSRVRGAISKTSGKLRVGFHGAHTAFAPLFQGFHELHPDIDVSVRVAEWLQLTNMVASGDLDAAVVEVHETQLRPELSSMPLVRVDEFCVAVSSSDPIASCSSVDVERVEGRTLLMSGYSSSSMDAMYRMLLAEGLKKERIRLTEDVDGAIAMAASGMGVAPMPMFLAIPGNPSVRWVPVNCHVFHCDLVLVYREDKASPLLSEFLKYCGRPGISEGLRAHWAAATTASAAGEGSDGQ